MNSHSDLAVDGRGGSPGSDADCEAQSGDGSSGATRPSLADIVEAVRAESTISSCDEAKWQEFAARHRTTIEGLLRQLIVVRHPAYYVLVDGDYKAPIKQQELDLSLPRDLARAPVEWTVDTEDGPRRKNTREMLLDYGVVTRNVIADLTISSGFYDPGTETFFEAVCQQRKVEPRFHSEIDQWLKLLGGPDAEKLQDWIATFDRLDRQTCALYLSGKKGAGKTMLATGLARYWSEAGPTELGRILDGFNADLARCPLVFADEHLPRRPPGQVTSAVLRQLVASETRTLSRKFLPNCDLRGAIRLILCANNDRMLALGNEDLSEDDLDAIAGRFLHIHVSDAPAKYLANIGGRSATDGWVSRDMILAHAFWLKENREVVPGDRFLVEGHATRMHRSLAMQPRASALALEWIARYLDGVTPDVARADIIRIGDGEILVNGPGMGDHWRTYIKSEFPPTTTMLGRALGNLAKGTSTKRENGAGNSAARNRNRRFHRINPELVFQWAEQNQVGDVDAMRKMINAPYDPYEWSPPGGRPPDASLLSTQEVEPDLDAIPGSEAVPGYEH
jgi:hypothetical protein